MHFPTFPARSHASHCPLHATSQHTLSTQWFDAHWLSPAQEVPDGFLGSQTPPEQKLPVRQSPSIEQLARQAVGPQVNSPQLWLCSAGQAPAPSQKAGRVATPAEQLAARHASLG
jgi:hypothetical protein